MLSELPDLDDDISFVVDNGASTGPIPLREIVESIRTGERAAGVLVWWAGATDWMRFDLHEDLISLLEDAEVVAEAPPEASPEAPAAESAAAPSGSFRWRGPKAAVEEAEALEAAEADGTTALEATEVEPTEVETTLVAEASEAAEAADVSETTEVIEDEVAFYANVVTGDPEVVEVAPPNEMAEAVAEPAQMHAVEPAAEADTTPVVAEPADESPESPDESSAPGESVLGESPDGFSFTLPTRETSDDSEPVGEPALTGLFSAGARVDAGLSAETATPSPDALDAILAARLSLESVGARIEALTSATRRSPSPEALSPLVEEHSDAYEFARPAAQSTELIDEVVETHEPVADTPEPSEPSVDDNDGVGEEASEPVAEEIGHENEPVLVSSIGEAVDTEVEAASAGSWLAVSELTDTATAATVHVDPVARPLEVSESTAANIAARQLLTERFEEMVRKSVAHQRRIEWVMRVDELLLSACITAIADSGFVAMDLTSRESDHRVLFEHNDDSRHVRLDLAPVEMKSDRLGRHVRFGLSWGRSVADIDVALETVSKEAVDGVIPPGVLTCSADMSNSVVSTHVELLLAADDLVKDDYSVDRPTLDASIAATLHALEERWKLLFTAG